MIGAIHKPQRMTRTVCATRPSIPAWLTSPLMGRRLRSNRQFNSTKLIPNSGAAIDQLITPASDSV